MLRQSISPLNTLINHGIHCINQYPSFFLCDNKVRSSICADKNLHFFLQDLMRDEPHQVGERNTRDELSDRQQNSKGFSELEMENDSLKTEELRTGINLKKESKHRELHDSQNRHSVEEEGPESQVAEDKASILERRKERFGKLKPKKSGTETPTNREEVYVSKIPAEIVEVKQERPARKRRWADSTG